MNKLLKKISACALSVLALSSAMPFGAVAKVVSVKEGGNGKTVYVAGNPDMYPIEYYDAKSKSYKGVIPDMLEIVSENTGIDFTYIFAGKEDKREELSKNGQVEIVCAFPMDEESFEFDEKTAVLTYKINNKRQTYCIGFTKVLQKDKAKQIKSALEDISDSQKMGLVISNTQKPRKNRTVLYIAIGAALVCVGAIGVLAAILRAKKKKAFSEADYTDKLTGVGNSDYYVYVFDYLISEQAKNLYSLMYLAFDCEKVEKQWGKNAVADIEKYIAAKLSLHLGSVEYVCRMQRGVFAFLFQSENAEVCLKRSNETVESVNKYLSEFNSDWGALVRGGVCRFCENNGVNSESAFYNARLGFLYAASKGLVCHIGSETQIAQNRKTDELRAMIADALKTGEFKIYMQLIADGKTGKFCGAEVLSRWQNGKYGLLRPYEYIELLKETEKVVEHDYGVFEQVCSILEQWSTSPSKEMFLTCNFTRMSLEKSDFAEKLNEISQKYNFPHERLVIEITEDSLNASFENLSKNVARCKEAGFKIAIDDMGAGFSSLADIYDNEIDIVKIERNFISSCVTPRRQKMLGDIITLVHNAEARVICEGIETAQQSEMLKGLNCDMMQGYFYSRVLPLAECERIIAR